MSKWTRLFSVNGPGLNFCGIFEDKNYRSAFGKIGTFSKLFAKIMRNLEKKKLFFNDNFSFQKFDKFKPSSFTGKKKAQSI